MAILSLILGGTAASKPEFESAIGRDISKDLRPKIANYLTRATSQPNIPFRLHIKADVTETKGAARVRHMSVRCRIAQVADYPALDVDLTAFVSQQMRGMTYLTEGSGASPTYTVEISYLPKAAGRVQYLDEVASFLFACLSFIIMAILRKRSGFRPIKSSKTVYQQAPGKQTNRGKVGGSSEIVDGTIGSNRHIHRKPTPQFISTLETLCPRLQGEGSWYLNALTDAPANDLRTAFSNLTFDEALIVLRQMSNQRRQQLVHMLELRPAICSRIDEYVANKSQTSHDQLATVHSHGVR